MLRLTNIAKKFGRHTALRSIDLEIAAGEIHGLAGVNGSGKSTLLNILFGSPVISRTGGHTGEIVLQGIRRTIKSPQAAIRAGLGMVHQEFAIIEEMTVAENITLTREPVFSLGKKLFGHDFSLIDRDQSERKAAETLSTLGLSLSMRQKAGGLSLSARQFLEIAREIARSDLKVLLLDEPTAVLNNEESALLLRVLKDLAEKGIAILYVSHRLDELFALCDRLTVLRNGAVSGRFSRSGFDRQNVTTSMTGGSVVVSRRAAGHDSHDEKREIAIGLRGFSVAMPGEALDGLDLDVRRGEILGVLSLAGHGKMALGPGLMGQFATSGKITVNGRDVDRPAPGPMIAQGLFMLPEDRRQAGLLLEHSIAENIAFSAVHFKGRFLRRLPLLPASFPDRGQIGRYAGVCIGDFDIACTGISQKVHELSGGNQQKVCIARALAMEPEVLMVNEPTRGIDLGAKERILAILLAANEKKGTTLVIASSELDELKRICDRIAVLYRGQLFAILPPNADDTTFIRAMSGDRSLH